LNTSEPIRWLLDHDEPYQIDCIGFGINLVTGNYEFACPITINDGRWWSSFGDRVEANWEAKRLRSRTGSAYQTTSQSTPTYYRTRGDYAMWGPGIDHSWRAEKDSIVITVPDDPQSERTRSAAEAFPRADRCTGQQQRYAPRAESRRRALISRGPPR
jgi:hypothetical protein